MLGGRVCWMWSWCGVVACRVANAGRLNGSGRPPRLQIGVSGFLTDENISSLVVLFLRDCQLDVFDVKENLLSGRRYSFLLDLAVKQQRVVITQDSNFGTLAVAARKPIYGILYLKLGHIAQHHTITEQQSGSV